MWCYIHIRCSIMLLRHVCSLTYVEWCMIEQYYHDQLQCMCRRYVARCLIKCHVYEP